MPDGICLAIVSPGAGTAGGGSFGLLLSFVLGALLFSFLCSIWEAVLLSVTPAYIEGLKDQGKPAGARLEQLKSSVERPLSAILTLNTIAHTVGATMAGTQAAALFDSVWLGIFNGIFTLLILIGSEIIPKTIGALHWRVLAPSTASAVSFLVTALAPFVKLSEWITRWLAGSGGEGDSMSREEFGAVATIAGREGRLDPREVNIVTNLLNLRKTTVESIRTPRTVVYALPAETTVRDYRASHRGFSRIPVYRGDLDHIEGFVLKDELLACEELDRSVDQFLRPLPELPAAASVTDAWQKLIDRQQHLAAVVDEFGGFDGLVSLEDVVETLLGLEIVDEADESRDMQELARRLRDQRTARYHQ